MVSPAAAADRAVVDDRGGIRTHSHAVAAATDHARARIAEVCAGARAAAQADTGARRLARQDCAGVHDRARAVLDIDPFDVNFDDRARLVRHAAAESQNHAVGAVTVRAIADRAGIRDCAGCGSRSQDSGDHDAIDVAADSAAGRIADRTT